MSELAGIHEKAKEDLKNLKGKVYDKMMSIITMSESALSAIESQKPEEAELYLKHIVDVALNLKGYAQ